MAEYPDGVYAPRDKENKAGIVYTPANKTIGYVEDVTKLDDEVVAIETELGDNPKGLHTNVAERLEQIETGVVGNKTIIIKVIADDTELATGDGITHITIPGILDGWILENVGAHVYTVSSSGLPTIQVHNLTTGEDMLSTEITIDENEKDSSTATTPPVIDGDQEEVSEADEIRIDVDVAGTGTLGLEIRLEFQKL